MINNLTTFNVYIYRKLNLGQICLGIGEQREYKTRTIIKHSNIILHLEKKI